MTTQENSGCVILVTLLLIGALAGGALLIEQLNRRTLDNQARIAEAQVQIRDAAARQAYYDAVAAQARVEEQRAEGERAVLESAARAVDGNTDIVALLARDAFPASINGWLWGAILTLALLWLLDLPGWLRWRFRNRRIRRTVEPVHNIHADRVPETEEWGDGDNR